jgi:hypothetical protein
MELKFHVNIKGGSMLCVEILKISKYRTMLTDIIHLKESNKRCKEIGYVTIGLLLQQKFVNKTQAAWNIIKKKIGKIETYDKISSLNLENENLKTVKKITYLSINSFCCGMELKR